METKIKKYKNLKLIKYNKIIFEYLLKLSQSKIHKRKIHQNVFVKNILRSENKIYNKYINYLDEIYF